MKEVSVDLVLGQQAGSQVSCDCTGGPQGLLSCAGLLTPAPAEPCLGPWWYWW